MKMMATANAAFVKLTRLTGRRISQAGLQSILPAGVAAQSRVRQYCGTYHKLESSAQASGSASDELHRRLAAPLISRLINCSGYRLPRGVRYPNEPRSFRPPKESPRAPAGGTRRLGWIP